MKGKTSLIVAVLIATGSYNAMAAQKPAKLVSESFYGANVSFDSSFVASDTTVTVVGPDGFRMSKTAKSGLPSIDLMARGQLRDGFYSYELTSAVGPMVKLEDDMNNGRDENKIHYGRKGITQSGYFTVVNGQIKQFSNAIEANSSIDY